MTENKVAVEQIDRDAAADLMVVLFTGAKDLEGDLGWSGVVRNGEDDTYPIVQAFARHRTRALEASQAGAGEWDDICATCDGLLTGHRPGCPEAPVQTEAGGSLREQAEAMKAIGAQSMLVPIDALIAALTTPARIEAAQPQEAAWWIYEREGRVEAFRCRPEEGSMFRCQGGWTETPLYATPPIQAADSGLLDEAIEMLEKCASRFERCADNMNNSFNISGTLRAERALYARHCASEARAFVAKAGKQGEGDREG